MKVNDGDILKFGKFELEVRATPGHTNGKFLFATVQQASIRHQTNHNLALVSNPNPSSFPIFVFQKNVIFI